MVQCTKALSELNQTQSSAGTKNLRWWLSCVRLFDRERDLLLFRDLKNPYPNMTVMPEGEKH